MSIVEPILIVLAAAALSAGLIVVMLPWLRRNALAHPNARSSHRKSTPQGGGVAVIASTLVVTIVATALGPFDLHTLWPIITASLVIAVVGAVDDLHTLEVVPRLALQAFAVLIVIAAVPDEIRVLPMLPWLIERMLLLIACLWFVNLTNFMDGIDWMTVAEFVPVAAGLALVGYLGALPPHGITVALAAGGAVAGFAPFNRPVARIFLGDVGSLPIGLLFGWLLVMLAGNGHLVAALLLPLYYLADATLTLSRRIKNREPFWQAHRTHFYQCATDRGWSVMQIVGHVFVVNIVLVTLAAATVLLPGIVTGLVALAAGCALVGWLLRTLSHGSPS
jgi:UDP-N-acetylmuramyl pentapeptide phosphotransferase/UDP-N-acetylglucosamine-1-phosphate transferase